MWRWLSWGLLFLLLLGGGLFLRARGNDYEPAPLTENSPAVNDLRELMEGANIVICVLDAARADHVGCYGYPRETTPNIDRLARESVLFKNHFTQYVSTKPATASLFTGQYADTHLAYENRELAEGTFTLARGLKKAGYRTVMFSSNPNASPKMGLGLDFQKVYDQSAVEPMVDNWEQFTNPEPMLVHIREWIATNKKKRFFAYIHFDPPHKPYLQPEEMTKLFAGKQPPNFKPGRFAFPVEDREEIKASIRPPLPEWINLYDANLRFADWAVGEVEQALKKAGAFDRTLFIITADHGEAFGEHGYMWHEFAVYDELVHVPLVMRFPEAKKRGKIEALTQTVDLLPTLFDLLAKPYPREVQGKSLTPLLAGTETELHKYVISRSDGKPPSYLVRSQEWALMLWGNGKWRALYDLKADPGQRKNVMAEHPKVAAEMTAVFRQFAAGQRRPPLEFVEPGAKAGALPKATERKLTEETKRQLKALGYVK